MKDEEIARLKAEYKLSMEEHLASSSERYVYMLLLLLLIVVCSIIL